MRVTQARQNKAFLTFLLVAAALALALLAPDADARARCAGLKADIVGGPGNNVIVVPAHGQQVIVGGGGNDRIVAKRNHDVICGGDGNDVIDAGQGDDIVLGEAGDDKITTGRGFDVVHGGDGNDVIDAGSGGDKLFGDAGDDSISGDTGKDQVSAGDGNDSVNSGPGGDNVHGDSGNDILQGDAGGDQIHGDSGDDRLYGELQDDHLYGDDGNDLLIGDQGIDDIQGGSGDDWMRGGTNQDVYHGGSGSDWVSFATATPPGPTDKITGVQVDLVKGFAKGDGGQDTIRETENVLGSPYDDKLTGNGGLVDGLIGNDDCDGGQTQTLLCSTRPNAFNHTHAMLTDGVDPGLIVMPPAGPSDEAIKIASGSGGYSVTDSGPVDTGGGCDQSAGGAFCQAPEATLGFVVAYGGDGDDRITVGPGLARTTTVDLDGGNGDDRLEGSDNNDNLYAGDFGQDTLIGNGGSDALISAHGPDVLLGGSGNDQLVTEHPCDGHLFDGGTGAADVAGFGRTWDTGVIARLGGTAVERAGGDPSCHPTEIRSDLEVLEGTRHSDILYARTSKNLLIGREGSDTCVGGRHMSC